MGVATDRELVRRYRESGQVSHLDELVRRHVGRVRATVYPMVLNDADADDVTQEVFLRVVKGMARFREEAEFSSWLYRITMNTARSFLRRRNARPVEQDEDPDRHAGEEDSGTRRVLAKETDAEIARALADLSPRLRAAITLTAIRGLSAKEAAAAEACLPATMYWRIHEARRILKQKLARYMAS